MFIILYLLFSNVLAFEKFRTDTEILAGSDTFGVKTCNLSSCNPNGQ